MLRNMYTAAGDCPGNEKLVLRMQSGDRNAAELLISQNEGYLTKLAREYTSWCELEDLKQEGRLRFWMRQGDLIPPTERSC